MELIRATASQIVKDTFILLGLLCVLGLFLPQRRELLTGLVFGTLIAVLNFRLLEIAVRKFSKSANPTRFLRVERLKRFFIYGVAFTVAVRKSGIDNASVLLGFLLPKIAIYWDVWHKKNILALQEKVK